MASDAQSLPPIESVLIHKDVNQAPGVQLSPHQKLLVGSVLDLFAGHPTLAHLSLWSPTATFTDPLTDAQGYDRFAAQWYGLAALFRPIEIQAHRVISSGNPLEFELRNRYTVKGIGVAQTIESTVRVFVNDEGKIARVEDRWGGKLPEGVISETFRKLNAVMVPKFVTVPKTVQEDMEMQAKWEK